MVVGLVAALILATAPEPETAGSVEGPNVWLEARALWFGADVGFSSLGGPEGIEPRTLRSLMGLLTQGRVFAGWGFAPSGQRVLLGVSAAATGVSFDGGTFDSHPRFIVAPIAGVLAVPVSIGRVVLTPLVSVAALPPQLDDTDTQVTGRAELRARGSWGRGLMGGALSAEVPVGDAARSWWSRRCTWNAFGCETVRLQERGFFSATTQVEFWPLESLSVGGTLRVSSDLEFNDVRPPLRQAGPGEVVPIVQRPAVLARTEVRLHAFASWAFAAHFGLTLDASAGRVVAANVVTNLLSASLSVWFRLDSRLQPRWLDH
ncbi:MAG TPA: hypothetical protein VGE37_07410 [Archangium sp.]